MTTRREALALGAWLTAVLSGAGSTFAAETGRQEDDTGASPFNVFIPGTYVPPSGDDIGFRNALKNATLSALESAYGEQTVPIWGEKLADIDLERRVDSSCGHVLDAVSAQQNVYPVDPVLVLANMWVESSFCEFAISPALAVGPSQLMRSVARDQHHLVCGGDRPEHANPPYLLTQFAGSLDRYVGLRGERSKFVDENRSDRLSITNVVDLMDSSGLPLDPGHSVSDIMGYVAFFQALKGMRSRSEAYDKQLAELDRGIRAERDNYLAFLRENFKGKDIFDEGDVAFLNEFDQRVLPGFAIPAMVDELARGLRARNGFVPAVVAGYNVGLSRTSDGGHYGKYGGIPAIDETARHVSRVMINYHEISERL